MRSKSRLFVLVITLSLACTRDPRIRAVDELLEFVTGAPYTVEVTTVKDWEFLALVVRVDALDRFNRIYAYFGSGTLSPAQQRDQYKGLQYTFVQYLPVIAVDEVNYDFLGDTIKVSAVVRRPDRTSYNTRLVEWTESHLSDRDDPTSLDQSSLALEFQNRLSRAMAEPPTVDTIWVSVVDGPRITSLRTSTMVEDSLETVARRDSIGTHVRAVVDSAYFDAFEVRVGSSTVSVTGTVYRPSIGWMPRNIRDDDVLFVRYWVQCRGVGAETPLETGYINTDGTLPWDDFICMWIDESEMATLGRVRQWEVRLTGIVFGDSILGEWTRARGPENSPRPQQQTTPRPQRRFDIQTRDRFDVSLGDRDAKFVSNDGIQIWQGTSLRVISGVTAGADVVIIQAITTVSGEQLVRVEVISRNGSRDGAVGWMPSRYLRSKVAGATCFAKFGGLGSRRLQRCEGR